MIDQRINDSLKELEQGPNFYHFYCKVKVFIRKCFHFTYFVLSLQRNQRERLHIYRDFPKLKKHTYQ